MSELQGLQDALRARYDSREWVVAWEVADATGSAARRRADAVAVGLWPSRGMEIHVLELKLTRADWRREQRNPEKAEAVARYADRFYIVAPSGVVPVDELPPRWGLLELASAGLRATRQAEALTPAPITRQFMAALLRSTWQQVAAPSQRALDEAHAKGRQIGHAAGFRAGERGAEEPARQLRALQASVDAFHRGCGVELLSYNYRPERIGEAVAAVLEGTTALSRLRFDSDRIRAAADELHRAVEQALHQVAQSREA